MNLDFKGFEKYVLDQSIKCIDLHNNFWEPLFHYEVLKNEEEKIIEQVRNAVADFPGIYYVKCKVSHGSAPDSVRKIQLDTRTPEQKGEVANPPQYVGTMPQNQSHVNNAAPLMPYPMPRESTEQIEERVRRDVEARMEIVELKRKVQENETQFEKMTGVSNQITTAIMSLIQQFATSKKLNPILQGQPQPEVMDQPKQIEYETLAQKKRRESQAKRNATKVATSGRQAEEPSQKITLQDKLQMVADIFTEKTGSQEKAVDTLLVLAHAMERHPHLVSIINDESLNFLAQQIPQNNG